MKPILTKGESLFLDKFCVKNRIISKNKASQEKSVDFYTQNESFIHTSNMIRSRENVIFWIIDFILVRQPGMAIFISTLYIISLVFNSVLYFMSGLLFVYFILIYSAIFSTNFKLFAYLIYYLCQNIQMHNLLVVLM